MASTADPQPTAKPGTACLCCRRRKLKCSREPAGCANCVKADLPCVYTGPEAGVKRKRGPYRKKEKPAREEHLEHVVKYLSDPVAPASSSRRDEADRETSPGSSASGSASVSDATNVLDAGESTKASEDLVKDALAALTNTSMSERELRPEDRFGAVVNPLTGLSSPSVATFTHPSARHAFELWHLFTSRVDPLTRIVDCLRFAPRLFAMLDGSAPGSSETLACSVYYAAISSCSAKEARSRFGQGRRAMLGQYSRSIEAAVAQNYGMPDLDFMQALLLYLTCLRRDDVEVGMWALFSLAVRNGQMMGLHVDPGDAYLPYEAEARRRIWWTICSLESRCAEEGASRTTSLMESNFVRLPANLTDNDLRPESTEIPKPRDGLTSMSFSLVRWEVMRLSIRLWAMKKETDVDGAPLSKEEVRRRQAHEYRRIKAGIDSRYLQHCHQSRPYDWLILSLVEVMMTKCRLTIEYPWGQMITRSMTPSQRLDMLRSSVVIIRTDHLVLSNPKTADWFWWFRGFMQWHCLAIVVAEVGNSSNPSLTKAAWAALAPFLEVWDTVYEGKQHDATWEHVNTLIQRARAKAAAEQTTPPGSHPAASHSCTSGLPPLVDFSGLTSTNNPSGMDPFATLVPDIAEPSVYPDSTSYQGLYQGAGVGQQPAYDARMPAPGSSAADSNVFPGVVGPGDQGIAMPDDIDFDALNAVFGSPSWQTAVRLSDFDVDMN